MSYPVELKETLQKRLENGEKPKKISEETGISIPTLYNWKRELEEKKILNSKTKKIMQTSEEIEVRIPKSKQQQIEPTIMKKEPKTNKTAKKNKFKEGLQYQVQPLQTKDVHKFSMKELKEMRNDIYVRMQSEDIQVHKKAVEQWDKMERLLDKMKRERKDYLEL